MKKYKTLHISGALLDKNQLANYMEKLASDHNVKNYSDSDTYPIPSLKENYEKILETYRLLNKHIKLGIKIHSAGDWILDNFYIIEENVKEIQKELTLKKYKSMVGIANGKYEGFARSYCLAAELVAFSDGKVDSETIDVVLKAYQNKKLLSMQEIWNIGIFLKIALVAQIADIAEKIYSSQIQKYRAESIIERALESSDGKNKIFMPMNQITVLINEPKYPFIEYMSYKLKMYGKRANDYQEILEKEVSKMGITVSEVIQKEHFYIANLKITIGNSIKSLKEISRINFGELFSHINGAEEILNFDPTGVYPNMDEESKAYYRGKLEKISKKNKVSEIYVAEKMIELCKKYQNAEDLENMRKAHVGYYLIDDGINELYRALEIKPKLRFSKEEKAKFYVSGIILGSLYIDFLLSMCIYLKVQNALITIFSSILFYIPVHEIFVRFLNYILSKVVKPTLLPKMNFEKEIPKEATTFVVIPTILNSSKKVKEMMHKLEVYYLANRQNNLYFALLGDCTEENQEFLEIDKEIANTGLEEASRLNQKYSSNKFFFLYRKRTWNACENSYIGWERKRGLLTSFNLYIKNKLQNNFLINTIDGIKENLPEVKYIITLDSDTNLSLETANKLVGTMEHILNRPIIKENKVVSGYGIAQPRIGLDLELSKKSKFIELFSMQGGVDFYSNAISDIYQDCFGEGIFTGKGIYNVDVYNEILDGEIPENTVLSHDLLEGNFLRCALITDIVLLDGFPTAYLPYIMRNHRWTRGDVQIVSWVKSKRLNLLSKFKIFDNLRRSLVSVLSMILIISSAFFYFYSRPLYRTFLWLGILSSLISYIIDLINYIVFKESYIEGAIYADKKFSNDKSSIEISLYRILLQIMFLPYESFQNLDAIFRSLYRKKHHCRMLEWVTAEDGEKNKKSSLQDYYSQMKSGVIIGFIFLFIKILVLRILGVLWIISPIFAWYISLKNAEKREIALEDRKYLEDIGRKTWKFFENYINEENNYLMIDNYQEDRDKKIVNRTSSTNIGLELLSVVSAYDLGYINYKNAIKLISKIISTVNNLSKWNGHLYNWYNTKTLEPLIPRYISSVDSGNFVGYLYVLREFLIENKNKQDTQNLINTITELINNTDFSYLYNPKTKLLSVGFNLEDNKLTDSYYDFLASEARQASLVAIAKKDIPVKHWNNLSRTLTSLNKYKGLVSWSGTAFEYLMPNLNLQRYKGSLLDEASQFAIMSQIEYMKKLNIPWGISESAFNLKDLNNNYQYKAFGIPWLGFKRGLENDFVISPYSTFLSLEYAGKMGINNLKLLEQEGLVGKYGFYESIDYTKSRLKLGQEKAVVKTYMAHHQGLILLSINNFLNDNIIRNRFNNSPEIEAVNILLEERMPINTIITKEKKEKISKFVENKAGNYAERKIENKGLKLKELQVLSNEDYKIVIDEDGNGKSMYRNNLVNYFKDTDELSNGIYFYIRNIRNKRIIRPEENANIIFAPERVEFSKQDGNLKLNLSICIAPDKNLEIRRLEIENFGNNEEIFEVFSYFEPILSGEMEEYAHPAFNKLFLKISSMDGNIIAERKGKLYLGANLYTENEQIGDFEYEICKEKALKLFMEGKHLSSNSNIQVDKVIAIKKTLKIPAKEKVSINLLLNVAENKEELIEDLENLKSEEEIIRNFELAKARSEEELKYLQVDGERLIEYQELLKYILHLNPFKITNVQNNYKINDLWSLGISGDKPIILLKIQALEESFVLEEVLNCFRFYRAKKIDLDLVILNQEKNVYEKYVRDCILEILASSDLSGIHIIDKSGLEKEKLDILEFKANLVIDASKGGIRNLLKEYDEKLKLETKNNLYSGEKLPEEQQKDYNLEKLEFYNEYGGFGADGKEYKFSFDSQDRLSVVWSNVLANKFFGTVVTENLGGYTWYKNSRLNRLTAWANDPIVDFPSEIFYIRDMEKNYIWTLNSNVNSNSGKYVVTHGIGFTKLENEIDNVSQEVKIIVPIKDPIKFTMIKLKNNLPKKRMFRIVYYLKNLLGEDELKTNGNIITWKEDNIIFAKNLLAEEEFKDNILFVTSNLKIKSFTGEKENFLGGNSIGYPSSLFEEMNNQSGVRKNSCIAIALEVELESYEEKEFFVAIGEDSQKDKIVESLQNLNVDNLDDEVKRFWDNKLGILNIKTPERCIDILVNNWFPYQTISSRIYGRTGYYQSGGAIGFRDQLQDAICLKYIDIENLKNQIIISCAHQFIEGDVLHWWHEETKKGIKTKITDDLLWLVYAVIEYIDVTRDEKLLNEEVEYLVGENLEEGKLEKYFNFHKSNIKETVFRHCIKSIEKVLERGLNPFPKIGTGDWNDGFSTLGKKGIGESIWLGFFLYDILNRFIPICENQNRDDLVKKYTEIKEDLKKNLNTVGWDGRWFKRAISDDGEVVGSLNSKECRIDSISQSWSIISGAGDNDKKFISMENAENYLVDRENKVIKLFDPPFENWDLNVGYIKNYLPGIRENGGQYTHAAVWFAIAEAILGFGDKAVEFLKIINPINHTSTKEDCKNFKLEPYILPADVYSTPGLEGRGGWNWYTGASGWYIKAVVEYVIGFKIKEKCIIIEPSVPKSWKEFGVNYKYKSSTYNIKIKNPNEKNCGVDRFIIDGNEIKEKKAKLENDGKIHIIEIYM